MRQIRRVFASVRLWKGSTWGPRLIIAGIIAVLLVVGLVPAYTFAAPAESSSAAPTQSGFYYTVQRGDTLYSIARRYGTTATAIASANGIANINHIRVGQRLTIPGYTVGSTPWPVDSTHYVVRAGDSLSVLARRFNTTVQAIARANGIADTSHIRVGQRLIIPTGYAYPPSVYGFYYTVKAGDTLSSIAKWYGVNLNTLASANWLSNVDKIYVGQRLYIP
ncbi:MAG: LysM peptidoglycan-binding domain-containing protein [Caldilineaceae bacterium]|nr:LysM peptidoglycan-binding domain-containing protein [Caldilineaceae bacterium]